MSEYCRKRQQNRPFSHIVMDLHQEALAGIEASADILWGLPTMPKMVPRATTRSEPTEKLGTFHRRWRFPKPADLKITKEVATSMEDLSMLSLTNTPGKIVRPKSMCVPDSRYNQQNENSFFIDKGPNLDIYLSDDDIYTHSYDECSKTLGGIQSKTSQVGDRNKKLRVHRNPVQRAASRLYRVGMDFANRNEPVYSCIGPEFVVKASLPSKKLELANSKSSKKFVVVILLDGQKLEIACNPSNTTAGQLLELIFQEEHIDENFMFGLSALIAGDFVFIPSDTRISKVMNSGNSCTDNLTLYLRVRFFLPSLRGIRGTQVRHFLYLQLRRSILEHQLPSSFSQIIELNGLALQAEFGNYEEMEHGTRDYFLLEHYVPETMTSIIDDEKRLKEELIKAHISKKGLEREKAELDFIIFTQNLPHYGGHFYSAIWMLKDNNKKDVWLYISAQGINLYERGKSTSHFGPQLYESFEWKSIQTLCYTKHYLCILPHNSVRERTKLKKYKLKMDHKKSYFAFRLASLHHQFFLRLRTEYTSSQSLSQQFGIPLKDIKNEKNSLCKLEAYRDPIYSDGPCDSNTQFRVEFKPTHPNDLHDKANISPYRRTKSVQDISRLMDQTINEDQQNKENEKPTPYQHRLVLDSSYFAGLPIGSEKRRGVKMGTRAFSKIAPRASRSMEAVNDHEYLEQMSLESMSFHCSSTSMSKTSLDGLHQSEGDAFVLGLDSTLKSVSQQNFLPNFQETINDTLLHKLNNLSFAEERILCNVVINRDSNGSLGLQITEGSDGNVYVHSVVSRGSSYMNKNIRKGDQVIAVNGQSLLGRKYSESLELLKNTDEKVELVLARAAGELSVGGNLSNIPEDESDNIGITMETLKQSGSNNSSLATIQLGRPPSTESQLEKHNIESCHDLSNCDKFINMSPIKEDISYHMRRQYSVSQMQDFASTENRYVKDKSKYFYKTASASLSNLATDHDRAVIVDMIPKKGLDWPQFTFDDRIIVNRQSLCLERERKTDVERNAAATFSPIKDNNNREERYLKREHIALPRSLGLSRKWKGPVRYPVTPVKKTAPPEEGVSSTSEEEQVFI